LRRTLDISIAEIGQGLLWASESGFFYQPVRLGANQRHPRFFYFKKNGKVSPLFDLEQSD
jgi:hypothetical protein